MQLTTSVSPLPTSSSLLLSAPVHSSLSPYTILSVTFVNAPNQRSPARIALPPWLSTVHHDIDQGLLATVSSWVFRMRDIGQTRCAHHRCSHVVSSYNATHCHCHCTCTAPDQFVRPSVHAEYLGQTANEQCSSSHQPVLHRPSLDLSALAISISDSPCSWHWYLLVCRFSL